MRTILPIICLLLCGCVAFFSEGETEIGVIPRDSGSNVVVRTVLRRDAHAIRFDCATPTLGIRQEDRVVVTLTNTSTSRTISLQGSGASAEVQPRASAVLYDGSLSTLLSGKRMTVI
jgi:hypothetical protein